MKSNIKKELDLTPLERYSLEDISLAVILDSRREKKDSLYPVKYRVTYQGKQLYYPCMDLTEGEYSALHGAVKGKNLRTKRIIQDGFDNIKMIIQDMQKARSFSMERLNTTLSKGTKNDVLIAFSNKIRSLDKAGKVGTAAWYTCAKNSIERFVGKSVKFASITPPWLEEYESHMLEEGNKYTTISINMRALRAILNDGIKAGILPQSQYPFSVGKKDGKYVIPEGEGRKIALNENQVLAVFRCPLLPDQERWRDLWIFSFYCNGANISDILRFKYENVKGDYIEWFRGKTVDTSKKKIQVRAFIRKELRDIIIRYGNPDVSPSNYIFPILKPGLTPMEERMIIQNSIHTINKKMTMIGKALKIGNITTYWARHSWASISRRGGVSLFGISKGMGHKSLSTTQIYLDSLSDDELIENASKLPGRHE